VRLNFGYNSGGFIDTNSGKKTDKSKFTLESDLVWQKGIVSVFLPSVPRAPRSCIRKTNQYDGKALQVEPDKQDQCYPLGEFFPVRIGKYYARTCAL
jgi:hypothetical protein